MPILVRNIRLGLEQTDEDAFDLALQKAGLSRAGAGEMHMVKTAVDARRRDSIRLVCSVELSLGDDQADEAAALAAANADVAYFRRCRPEFLLGTRRLPNRPVVVGFGPAGMFAALLLARQGYRPLVLERGGDVDSRTAKVERFWGGGALDVQSNVQFGEGGAGTFSDGKLTTRINDPLCGYVLEEIIGFGAPAEIRRRAKPHIGTDHLRRVVKALREEIVRLGGEVRFGCRLTGLSVGNGRLTGYRTCQGVGACQAMLLAPGHSARDTFALLLDEGLPVLPKPFSVGVRIEHLQRDVDRGLYGDRAGHPRLPVGEYQLSHREGERAVYTFCMCPGGVVVPAASQEGGVVVNGMSHYARDGQNANAALVVSVHEGDFGSHPLDGMAFQRQLEQRAFAAGGGRYVAPVQTAGLFLEGRGGFASGRVAPSYSIGTAPADFRVIFPDFITHMMACGLRKFGRSLRGFDAADSVLTGVETRTSSPVRIPRDQSGQCVGLAGLYPCGEGAGYAGGIMSAAVDGLKAAMAMMAAYAPPD